MTFAARVFLTLAAISFLHGCQHIAPAAKKTTAPSSRAVITSEALAPSPRLIIGRVISTEPERGFAFIELATDAPPAATAADTELISRTLDLRETGKLRASRHIRGRTLGTTILAGKPSAGDEVVWLAP